MDVKIEIRGYDFEKDYDDILQLYLNTENYGGQFNDNRDSEEKLKKLSLNNNDKLLVALIEGKIVGSVTLFEDGRAAWLYRFAVQGEFEDEISLKLY